MDGLVSVPLQYGAFALCALLIVAGGWMFKLFVKDSREKHKDYITLFKANQDLLGATQETIGRNSQIMEQFLAQERRVSHSVRNLSQTMEAMGTELRLHGCPLGKILDAGREANNEESDRLNPGLGNVESLGLTGGNA